MSRSIGIGLGITKLQRAGGGGFVPVANDRLVTWLHADTAGKGAGTISDTAGSVSEWRDPRTAAMKYTQGSAGSQPTTGAVTQNGKNVVSASGSAVMSAVLDIDPTQPIYMFNVMQVKGINNQHWSATGTSSSRLSFSGGLILRQTNTNAFNFEGGNSSTDVAILSDYRHINSDANSFDRYENGVQMFGYPQDLSSNKFTTQKLTLGFLFDRSSGYSPLTGWIAEHRLYVGTLTAQEIADIRDEMNAEWDVY